MTPSVASTIKQAATGITLSGAVGLTLVSSPATVGDAYKMSPTLKPLVSSVRTEPQTVQ